MHKAIVAKIAKVEEIAGADNIQIAYVLGEVVIVQKTSQVGDIGVFFMPDLQLSEEFCHENNLFRDSSKNKDTEQKGFFENNRRVRAQPFLKVKSEGFFVPLSYFDYTGVGVDFFQEGVQFDTVFGKDFLICQKFISDKTRNAMAQGQQKKKLKKVETPLFAQHVDTDQFKYHAERIPAGTVLSFHSKLHGTSARYSHTKVVRQLTKWQRIKNVIRDFLQLEQQSGETWEYVAGTRRVVLYENQGDKVGFNGAEQWRIDWLEALKPYLDKGMSVYGEIVGFANGAPIMGRHKTAPLRDKKFTKRYGEEMTYSYGCNEGQNRFFVYRVTQTLEDGTTLEYTPSQVIKWAEDRGLEHTFRVHEDIVYDGDVDKLLALVEELTERKDVMCEDITDPTHVSEGIIIRMDGEKLQPKFYKNKSYAFKVMEGIFKEDNVDLEDAS